MGLDYFGKAVHHRAKVLQEKQDIFLIPIEMSSIKQEKWSSMNQEEVGEREEVGKKY